MFAFSESLRQEIKLISPNTNISLLFMMVSAQISENCHRHMLCLLNIKQHVLITGQIV